MLLVKLTDKTPATPNKSELACGAIPVGKWSTPGYRFAQSKSLIEADYFYGLALDEELLNLSV